MKAVITYGIDGTTHTLVLEGGHISVQMFDSNDPASGSRANVIVADTKGGPRRRWVTLAQAWLIDTTTEASR